jgi:hypothetical protein
VLADKDEKGVATASAKVFLGRADFAKIPQKMLAKGKRGAYGR